MAIVRYGRRVSAGGFAHAVAIKELHPHLANNPELVSMFLDEARLAARVVHPNVVSVLDVVASGAQVWAVMQYIEGESLGRLAASARGRSLPTPVGVAVAIALDLLAGLDAAHRATDERGQPLGIVHRDVSPQNVLVGVDGVARVLDFGVAKARGRLHETRDGQVKGKLAYMAPEQLGGEASPSTDVYAAAIVLWELLAGRRLFEAETELELIGRVLTGALTSPGTYGRDVSAALDGVVMKGLSLDPQARFASASDMARALSDACAGRIATRAEVAAWVSSLAGDALAKRRELAARMVDAPSSEETRADVRQTIAPVVATVVMPPLVTPARGLRRSASLRWGAAVALVACVIGAGATASGVVSAKTDPAPAAPRSASVLGATFAPVVVTRAPAAVPRNASPVRSRTAPAPSAPPAPPAAAELAAPPAESCDPPFVVDAMGVRHYKRACIR